MNGFDQISDEEIADAGFLAGLMTPGARASLVPLPVRVDGSPTIAFCIRAKPLGRMLDDEARELKILHPVALIPHRHLIIQDIRNGVSGPLERTRVLPLDVKQAKIMRAAMEDPNVFFGGWADTVLGR